MILIQYVTICFIPFRFAILLKHFSGRKRINLSIYIAQTEPFLKQG